MEKNELYHLLTLFLVSIAVMNTDLSNATFPWSVFNSLAAFLAFLVVVFVPAYVVADALTGAED